MTTPHEAKRQAEESLRRSQDRRLEKAEKNIRTFFFLLILILSTLVVFGVLVVKAGPNA